MRYAIYEPAGNQWRNAVYVHYYKYILQQRMPTADLITIFFRLFGCSCYSDWIESGRHLVVAVAAPILKILKKSSCDLCRTIEEVGENCFPGSFLHQFRGQVTTLYGTIKQIDSKLDATRLRGAILER